jgi:flavin reductase (DIM6/NTAB) family NADH-FMN oxidoreductase RutF
MSAPEPEVVDLAHASRLVNHGPTVLVSSAHAGRRNLMAAAWSMPVEFTPPRIAVVIDKGTVTCEMVRDSGMLALNIPGRALADITFTVGSISARDLATAPLPIDKFDAYGIKTFTGPLLGLPLVRGCAGWLECRVIPEPHAQQAYDTFFVEVVSALADPRVFTGGRWSMRDDNADLHTLHHLGAGRFSLAGVPVSARILDPDDKPNDRPSDA